ncbi:exodeoxyribonuclease VII small subunit [Alteromonas halophila]|uniref:exodeoxyribonuclease VII small subunit n=1 Tax=Alteromonas halophila TaxID=516698 RepID=UPI001676BBFF|nr:exodeoxyribonuclease VII small subunit [Alteromonas halophila]
MTDKPSSPSFEESLAELESIVNDMENGDLPLNEALEKFERGISLSRLSQQSLERAQQKVQILLKENGEESLADFSEPDAPDAP